MGPHGTPEERSAAEIFFALFRAKGYGVTNARGETATELYEKGYSSTTRDDKTIKLHIETAQEWKELTAKRLGVRIEPSYGHARADTIADSYASSLRPHLSHRRSSRPRPRFLIRLSGPRHQWVEDSADWVLG